MLLMQRLDTVLPIRHCCVASGSLHERERHRYTQGERLSQSPQLKSQHRVLRLDLLVPVFLTFRAFFTDLTAVHRALNIKPSSQVDYHNVLLLESPLPTSVVPLTIALLVFLCVNVLFNNFKLSLINSDLDDLHTERYINETEIRPKCAEAQLGCARTTATPSECANRLRRAVLLVSWCLVIVGFVTLAICCLSRLSAFPQTSHFRQVRDPLSSLSAHQNASRNPIFIDRLIKDYQKYPTAKPDTNSLSLLYPRYYNYYSNRNRKLLGYDNRIIVTSSQHRKNSRESVIRKLHRLFLVSLLSNEQTKGTRAASIDGQSHRTKRNLSVGSVKENNANVVASRLDSNNYYSAVVNLDFYNLKKYIYHEENVSSVVVSGSNHSDSNYIVNDTKFSVSGELYQTSTSAVPTTNAKDIQRTLGVVSTTAQPHMPPAHDQSMETLTDSSVVLLVVCAVVLSAALGVFTCVAKRPPLHRHATGADAAATQHLHATASMLSVVSGGASGVAMDRLRGGGGTGTQRAAAREAAAQRDRGVRLHSVHTDLGLDLPPSIELPDGEEHPYGSSARLKLRDPDQESEIYQKCIRPPPNRTVFESESPPPYRSSSAILLGGGGGSGSSSGSEWSVGAAPLVVRCHSMSSTSKRGGGNQGESKPDFLQRTVKILTGKRVFSGGPQQHQPQAQQQPPQVTAPPCVVVPSSRTRRVTDPYAAQHRRPNV